MIDNNIKMSYALLIGLNYSYTNNRLYGCINDCIRMRHMLATSYGFEPSNIVFMRDDIYNSSHQLYPNKVNIMREIKNLFALSKTTANLLYFHFSGHGSSIRDITNDERDGRDEFIVPADYFTDGTKIIDDELLVLTHQLHPSVPCFMIFDACHSGTMLDLNWSYTFNKSTGLFIKSAGTLTNSPVQNSIVCISGCNDVEVSLDVFANGQYNGALSNGLYNVMAQVPTGKLISVGSLVVNIYRYLIKNSFRQNPMVTTQLPLNLNNVAFLKSTNTVRNRMMDEPLPAEPELATPEPELATPEPELATPELVTPEPELVTHEPEPELVTPEVPELVTPEVPELVTPEVPESIVLESNNNQESTDKIGLIINILPEQKALINQINNIVVNKLMSEEQITALVSAALLTLK
jgi:hypothetical protein